MEKFKMSRCSTLVKAVFFGVILSVSWASFGQDAGNSFSSEATAVEAEQVNINHADAATIARVLDGIGMSRAEAIVRWRENYGEFATLEDLMMVKGVGEVTVHNNEGKIRFD